MERRRWLFAILECVAVRLRDSVLYPLIDIYCIDATQSHCNLTPATSNLTDVKPRPPTPSPKSQSTSKKATPHKCLHALPRLIIAIFSPIGSQPSPSRVPCYSAPASYVQHTNTLGDPLLLNIAHLYVSDHSSIRSCVSVRMT